MATDATISSGRCFTVRGRVQGVFFRGSTRSVALPLGLTGHAINLPNGDVEVLAFGNAAAIDKLAAWLQIGPPLSKVRDVMSEERPFEPRDDFVTG